jgi:octaheme c-type cytochrome (tetrathionate reductase family)
MRFHINSLPGRCQNSHKKRARFFGDTTVPTAWVHRFPLKMLVLALLFSMTNMAFAGYVEKRPADDLREHPADFLSSKDYHTDHSTFFEEDFATGPDVTRACLECHETASHEMMKTAHWRWEGEEVELPGRGTSMRIGKKNLLNNFCIGVVSNWPRCTVCHTGYGWEDENYDFDNGDNMDCLVCHAEDGTYAKGNAGLPGEDVDLLVAAKSVRNPSRGNCGSCHFNGGGGNAVKHGDLDQTLLHPGPRIDVHMGKHGFDCIDCHRTSEHNIPGRSISVSVDDANRVACIDCHSPEPHDDDRLNSHVSAVACQTCHIPEMAVDEATKTYWDWSTAGDKEKEKAIADKHEYMAIKGSFIYESAQRPFYTWYNGEADHYLLGDKIDPTLVTVVAGPRGSVSDPKARIWPFKLHAGKQIYDTEHNWLIVPKTFGEGGYWTEFDWDKACKLGAEDTGLPFSGSYDFAPTIMYWPLSHMVAKKEAALSCKDCHQNPRFDWKALGYPSDPSLEGDRRQMNLLDKGDTQ